MRSLVFLFFAITLSGCSGMMLGGGTGSSSGSSSTTGSSTTAQTSDIAITGMVREELAADSRVSVSSINVSTRNGVVRLSGVVRDYEARETAEKLAMSVDGVRAVENRISIE
jgi:hyperosmotically inducible protein